MTVTSLYLGLYIVFLSYYTLSASATTSKSKRDIEDFDSYGLYTMSVRFSNTWAVTIKDQVTIPSEIMAKVKTPSDYSEVMGAVAKHFGLINTGQIGNLDDTYLFKLTDGLNEERKDITEQLIKSSLFDYVEQQTYTRHVPKNK